MTDYLNGWGCNRLRTAVKHINMRRPIHRNNLAYHKHRWPNISVGEARNRAIRLADLLDRFRNIRVTQYAKHIFRITG